jgi:hypothetical protein
MPALLYFATSLAILALARRYIAQFTRAAALVLLLFPLTFTGRALLTGRLMAPVDIQYLSEPFYSLKSVQPYDPEMLDLATQMVPWRAAVREALGRGEWPLINPHTLCGDVLAGAAQPAVYSPFTLLACLMDPAASFNFGGAIAFFLAALGAFLFARDLGCGEVAALFGAAAYAFNGPLAFAILWPLGFSWALLPLVMLGARRVVREPGFRAIALLTTAFVLEILAGHPESTLHVVALGAVWGLFEVGRINSERGRGMGENEESKRDVPQLPDSPPTHARVLPTELRAHSGAPAALGLTEVKGDRSLRGSLREFLSAILAAALALGLTAIYLLPVIDAAGQTVEHQFRLRVFAMSKRAAPANEIAAGVLTSIFPWLHQQKWLAPMRTPAFIGIGSLVLAAAIAGAARRRDATTAALLALFAFCAAAALMMPPVSSLLHALPLLDVTLNERLLFGASFCAAMLAARGVSFLGWRTTIIVLALLVLGGLAVTYAHLTDGHVSKFRQYALLGELAPLAIAALVLFVRRRGSGGGASAGEPGMVIVLLALLLAQRVLEDGHWYPALARDVAFPKLAVLEPVQRGGGRMVGTGMTFLPNSSAVYGVDDVRGYEAMTFLPLAETYPLWAHPIPIWFNRVDDLTAPMLSMMNVRWALTQEAPEGWRMVQPGLAENLRVLPRAFVPRHVRLGTPPGLVLGEMRGETDFGARAWIGTYDIAHETANGPGTVSGDVVTMQGDGGWVVISQAAWHGWSAYVDGRPARVFTANHAFLSVFVPNGRHTLRLAFLPRSFAVGRAVTGVTLLLTTVLILVHRWRGTIAPSDEPYDRHLQRSQ